MSDQKMFFIKIVTKRVYFMYLIKKLPKKLNCVSQCNSKVAQKSILQCNFDCTMKVSITSMCQELAG